MSATDKVPTGLIYQISWFLSVVVILFCGIQIYSPDLLFGEYTLITILILLAFTEIITYGIWQLYIPITEFLKQLQRISLFLILYAIVQIFQTSNLLSTVASIVAIVAWSQLYAVVGGFSFIDMITQTSPNSQKPENRITFYIFLRLLINPIIGAIYLFIRQVNPDVPNEIELITAFSAFVLGWLIRYSIRFDNAMNLMN